MQVIFPAIILAGGLIATNIDHSAEHERFHHGTNKMPERPFDNFAVLDLECFPFFHHPVKLFRHRRRFPHVDHCFRSDKPMGHSP